MVITQENIKQVLMESPPKFSLIYPIGKHHFMLRETLKVKLTNGDLIYIPNGFTFDGSSVPRFLWWVFPSYGDFFFAAMIHDFCYITDYQSKKIGVKAARKFADKEMLIWSNILNNKSIFKLIDNYLRFKAVRWFGKRVYIR